MHLAKGTEAALAEEARLARLFHRRRASIWSDANRQHSRVTRARGARFAANAVGARANRENRFRAQNWAHLATSTGAPNSSSVGSHGVPVAADLEIAAPIDAV